MDDEYTCSISTHAITEGDIGQWNCDLQSFPFADVSLIVAIDFILHHVLPINNFIAHFRHTIQVIFVNRKLTTKTRSTSPLI